MTAALGTEHRGSAENACRRVIIRGIGARPKPGLVLRANRPMSARYCGTDSGATNAADALDDSGRVQPRRLRTRTKRHDETVAGFKRREVGAAGSRGLWNVDVVHARDRGACCDVRRKLSKRFRFAFRFDPPPDRVPAGAARGEGRLVAQRTVVPPERGEDDGALVRFMAML
jgi:hypothetical protein